MHKISSLQLGENGLLYHDLQGRKFLIQSHIIGMGELFAPSSFFLLGSECASHLQKIV